MQFTLHIWRQKSRAPTGQMVTYPLDDVSPDMSFLEMLDTLNERLIKQGEEPIAFDHDCREGICGSCAMMINGLAHGPERATTACQLHMRSFADGDHIYIEPWRAKAFPVVKDLVCDRSRLRPHHPGGRVRGREHRRRAGRQRDPGAEGGCRNGRWTRPRASAAGRAWRRARTPRRCCSCRAKVGHLANLPQGQPERKERVRAMVAAHDREGFGHCTNINECEAACPKEICVEFIAQLNRDFIASTVSKAVK